MPYFHSLSSLHWLGTSDNFIKDLSALSISQLWLKGLLLPSLSFLTTTAPSPSAQKGGMEGGSINEKCTSNLLFICLCTQQVFKTQILCSVAGCSEEEGLSSHRAQSIIGRGRLSVNIYSRAFWEPPREGRSCNIKKVMQGPWLQQGGQGRCLH